MLAPPVAYGLLAWLFLLTRTGSVSKVEMVTPMALIYKVLISSVSTFETPPTSL
jgi:hypothetical protein